MSRVASAGSLVPKRLPLKLEAMSGKRTEHHITLLPRKYFWKQGQKLVQSACANTDNIISEVEAERHSLLLFA